jgi:hypothetical protein
MIGGFRHKADCTCIWCSRIRNSEVAGKKQCFSVRLSPQTIRKIHEKCLSLNFSPEKLIESFLQDAHSQM